MIQRLKLKSEFSRNVLTLMTGTVIAQAIPIAISPILTRIYTPEDFGLFAFYMAIASIISVIATGRYELAIMLPEKEEDALNIAALSGLITVFVSLISFTVIFVFNHQIVLWIEKPEVSNWLYLIPLSVLVTGLYQSFNYWHNRSKNYKVIAKNRIIQSGITGLSQSGLGLINTGVGGLIFGGLAGQSLACSYLARKVYVDDKRYFRCLNLGRINILAKKYINFPKIDVPTTLINIASSQMPNILLTSLYSPVIAGYYYLTQRVLQAPITLISSSVLDVFKQRASEDYKRLGNAKQIYKKTFLALMLMGGMPLIILFFIVEDMFALVFGEAWRVAGTYAQILLPALFLRFMANPLSFMFYVAEKQLWNLMGMSILFLLVTMSFFLGESAEQVVGFLSMSYSVIYLFYIVFSYVISNGFFIKDG